MTIVNVPIVNSTLVNAALIEKRRQFIVNDCELLRRKFEIYGLELSDEVLQQYVKSLIIFNANVVWDLRAASYRRGVVSNPTYNTMKFSFKTPVTYSVPSGIKSIDPITLSFMSFEEAKSLIEGHISGTHIFKAPEQISGGVAAKVENIFDNTRFLSPFSLTGHTQIEASFQALYGTLNLNSFTMVQSGSNWYQPSNYPLQNIRYQGYSDQIEGYFRARAAISQTFQNPTLKPSSLIPLISGILSSTDSQSIPFHPLIDFEKIHYFGMTRYLVGSTAGQSNTFFASASMSTDSPVRPVASFVAFNYNDQTTINNWNNASRSGIYAQSLKNMPTVQDEASLAASYRFPSTDTRTDYQKVFSYSTYTPDNASAALNGHGPCLIARKTELGRQFVERFGGHKSIVQNLLWTLMEAHSFVNPFIDIIRKPKSNGYADAFINGSSLNQFFFGDFRKVIVNFPNPVVADYSGIRPLPEMEIYLMLNDNFSLTYLPNGQKYSASQLSANTTINSSYNINVPLDPAQPFPYYKISTVSGSIKNHVVSPQIIMGLQKLRNGFLFQDISRNFEATFVSFDVESINTLQELVSKQVSLYDLSGDVRDGVIYTKVITKSEPKQPFNPSQPEYVTTTSHVDFMKTPQGDIPIIHPELEYSIKWQQIHRELVIQSAFYYSRFMQLINNTVSEYNNRTASYISKLLQEMATLSTSYVQAEADRLKVELDQTALEISLEKLRTGVYIDDNGKEYWRKLLPEEQAEVNKLIAKIEKNIETERLNADILVANALTQNKVDEQIILANDEAQRIVDLKAIDLNAQYQREADARAMLANEAAQIVANEKQAMINADIMRNDLEWKHNNIDSIKLPSMTQLHAISKAQNVVISEALTYWENSHPFYSYNSGLVIE